MKKVHITDEEARKTLTGRTVKEAARLLGVSTVLLRRRFPCITASTRYRMTRDLAILATLTTLAADKDVTQKCSSAEMTRQFTLSQDYTVDNIWSFEDGHVPEILFLGHLGARVSLRNLAVWPQISSAWCLIWIDKRPWSLRDSSRPDCSLDLHASINKNKENKS